MDAPSAAPILSRARSFAGTKCVVACGRAGPRSATARYVFFVRSKFKLFLFENFETQISFFAMKNFKIKFKIIEYSFVFLFFM